MNRSVLKLTLQDGRVSQAVWNAAYAACTICGTRHLSGQLQPVSKRVEPREIAPQFISVSARELPGLVVNDVRGWSLRIQFHRIPFQRYGLDDFGWIAFLVLSAIHSVEAYDQGGGCVSTPRKLSWFLTSLLLLASFLVGAGTALAASALSSQVVYWGPAPVGGSMWCGKVQATVNDAGAGFATSRSSAYFGANCGNTHNVPAGYLEAQVHLVRSNGTLCGSTPWSFNGTSGYLMNSSKTLVSSTSCPPNASYHSSAHAGHFNPNTNLYVVSNFINSPNIPF
jgi:hypothetical protein